VPKEVIQVKTERYGFENLCTVDQNNSFNKVNGFTQKCSDILNALTNHYPGDEFRVLTEE